MNGKKSKCKKSSANIGNSKPTCLQPRAAKESPEYASERSADVEPRDESPATEGIAPSPTEPNENVENSSANSFLTERDASNEPILGIETEDSKWQHPFIGNKNSICATFWTEVGEAEPNRAAPAVGVVEPQLGLFKNRKASRRTPAAGDNDPDQDAPCKGIVASKLDMLTTGGAETKPAHVKPKASSGEFGRDRVLINKSVPRDA